jgi:hypothetical protein
MYFQVLWECIEHVKEMRNMHEWEKQARY